MANEKRVHAEGSDKGFSLIELLIVVTMVGILTAIAVPKMIEQRRLLRSTGVTREFLTQLRYTRQLAMSERKAYTFQYDASARVIKVIGPIDRGPAALATAVGYPDNAGSRVVTTASLSQGGLDGSEINYGIPSTFPSTATGALGDGVSLTALVSGKLNITFQPDGSVIDTAGNTASVGMFVYNSKAPVGTASAISVLGSSGRVKIWRYSVNATNYAE